MFSGFVKGVDPLGSAYKFHDYFSAFGLQFLNSLSLPLSVLLCTTEFMAGFSVITGIMRKKGIVIMIILMAIFTPLTLVLAFANPVSDCGCFGDAIHLTNWQTFIKNIILLVPVLILTFTELRKSGELHGSHKIKIKEWIVASAAFVVFVAFCLYNLVYLPVIDFLPYKKGTRIADKMVIPEGSKPDSYRTTFIYKKDGISKEFDLTNYPSEDTTWKFVDQKSVLIEKGYVPPIHDFAITDLSGNDLTSEILSKSGYTVLMISKKLNEAGKKRLTKGIETGKYLSENGIGFYFLTASGSDEIKAYSTASTVCSVDETTLKTMIRANPGYILLKNGVIAEKWSWANLPSKSFFDKL